MRAIDPALFTPGACVEFPPIHGDREQVVFLDAGHGGLDPGGIGSTEAGATVKESTVNLAIELEVMGLHELGRAVESRLPHRLRPGPAVLR